MKLRPFFSVLTALVITLLLISAAGFYWLTADNPLTLLRGGKQSAPAAAMFVPKQAPAMVSLLVNPDRLESFRLAVARPSERRRSRAELAQLKQNLLGGTGLNYADDIQPWLGDEVTLAVTTPDIDRDLKNGEQPGYLLAVATQDPARSREFLQLFWQKRAIAGTDLVFEQYSGVKLIYGSQAKVALDSPAEMNRSFGLSSPGLASAVVGDRFVMFANHPKVLRDAITNVQAPDLNLESSVAYQQALDQLSSRRIGLTYINLAELSEWFSESRETLTTPSSPAESRLYESLVAALEVDRTGLVADAALLTATGEKIARSSPALSKPVGALQFLPANTALAAAGTDLNQLWSEFSDGIQDSKALAELSDRLLKDWQNRWGIELPENIFQWVEGEYALGLLPRPDATADWIFVAEQSQDSEAAIRRLDNLAQARGLSIGPLTLNDQRVSAWTRLATAARPVSNPLQASRSDLMALTAEVEGVHATAGNYEIFTSSIAAMDQALQAPDHSLLENASFKAAIAPLADRNNGYLYIDWPAVQGSLQQKLPVVRLVELAIQPFVDHWRSLTLSSYGSEQNLQRGALFIRLRK